MEPSTHHQPKGASFNAPAGLCRVCPSPPRDPPGQEDPAVSSEWSGLSFEEGDEAA